VGDGRCGGLVVGMGIEGIEWRWHEMFGIRGENLGRGIEGGAVLKEGQG